MKIILFSSVFLVSSFCIAATGPGFVRIAKEDSTELFQTAIRTYLTPEGKRITLLGVLHTASESYWSEVQKVLDDASYVLYEGGMEFKDALLTYGTDACRGVYESFYPQMAKVHGLVAQWDALQYRNDWVHADLEAGPITAEYCEEAHRIHQEHTEKYQQLYKPFKSLQHRRAMLALSTNKGFYYQDPRNDIVLEKLTRALQGPNPPTDIAVIYGYGHMLSLESMIQKQLSAIFESEKWLTVFDWTSFDVKELQESLATEL